MAGKRQHFIQQALMRGFSYDSKRVYMFRKEATKGIKVAISKVGVERLFYGDEDKGLDGLITDFESTTETLLTELRNSTISNEDLLVKFIYITLTRTRNFRLSTDSLINDIVHAVASAINSVDAVKHLSSVLKNKPELVEEECYSELIRLGYEPETPQFNAAYKHFLFFVFANGEKIIKARQHAIQDFYNNYSKSLTQYEHNIGENSQSRVLVDILKGASPAIKQLARLNWKVTSFSSDIILGDSPVILINKYDYGVFHEDNHDMECVVMPIDKHHAVLGTKEKNYNITSDDLNLFSASTSHEYYVSCSQDDNHLMQHIGQNSGIRHSKNLNALAMESVSAKRGSE